MLTDTHSHLYWESFKPDYDAVIDRCIEAGVTTLINVGVDINFSKIAAELESNKVKFYSTIGIHPHESLRYAQGKLEEDIKKLEDIYRSNPEKVVGVGECGLDYYFDPKFTPSNLTIDELKELQRKLFKAQIELAKKLNLPSIVHCRDDRSKDTENSEAWNETLEMIGNHPTILHCYSGLAETTKQALKKPNVLFSFAATITYPKNEYLREAARILPLERIVLETDCPFLPPQSKRGERNEPTSVVEIAKLIADLRGVSFEEIAKQTSKNVVDIFKLYP